MDSGVSTCPASLSFIFKVVPDKNILKMGSIGIGCTLNKKVTTTAIVSKKNNITFNGDKIEFPTVRDAIAKLIKKKVSIDIKSDLPLGYGFGISAASTLSSLCSLNSLLHLKVNNLKLAEIAHESEIINKTGLGSVTTQITGGFLIKQSAGFPVKVQKLPFAGEDIFATIIGPIPTPSILAEKKLTLRINKSADKALSVIKRDKHPTLAKIIDWSFEYALNSGLLTNTLLRSLIDEIRKSGGHATMAMLGQVIISDINPRIKNFQTIRLKIGNK